MFFKRGVQFVRGSGKSTIKGIHAGGKGLQGNAEPKARFSAIIRAFSATSASGCVRARSSDAIGTRGMDVTRAVGSVDSTGSMQAGKNVAVIDINVESRSAPKHSRLNLVSQLRRCDSFNSGKKRKADLGRS